MDINHRRKVYHRTRNNSQRLEEIRESIRVRSRSKKLSENQFKIERKRDKCDLQKHISESETALLGGYDERCAYLNNFNRILNETKLEEIADNELFEDICSLILKFLKDDHPCIRAMCFHILRKSTQSAKNLVVMLTTHVDIYVVRAIDLQIENEAERIEAFKLINWMMKIYENSYLKKLINSGKKYAFPKSIMQPIISIALAAFQKEKNNNTPQNSTASKKEDRMAMPCVGLFLEFSLTEPELILEMAGTDWIVRVLTGITTMSGRIVTLVSHVLIVWLDNPILRVKANLHLVLEQIFAPLVEYGLFQKRSNIIVNDSANESFHMSDVLDNFKSSFLCILRSWPGLLACTAFGPNSSILSSSPLRLLEYLGLGMVENENLVLIRDTIVDLCCEFIDVPYASKTFTSWDEALQFYKNMHLPDKFKSSLKNDFVIAQNDARLMHDVDRERPYVDLLASFRCLSQFVLINAGLPQSLSRLILAMPDSSSGLKATLLMADILRAAPSHVPTGWRAPVLSLPTLVQSACETLIQSKASAAIMGTFDLNNSELYTFVNAENAELVLHRIDHLNQSWIRSATNSSIILEESDLQLFVPHIKSLLQFSKLPGNVKKSRSDASIRQKATWSESNQDTVIEGCYEKGKFIELDDFDDYDYSRVDSRKDTFEEDESSLNLMNDQGGKIDWNAIEYHIQILESETINKLVKEFGSNSMMEYVSNILVYFHPSEQEKNKRIIDRQHTIIVKSLIKLLLRIMPYNESVKQDYASIISKYVSSFRSALENRHAPHSYFAIRNLTYTGSMFHFAIIGTLSLSEIGLGILNDVGVMHQYVELMAVSTQSEYVKLIVSSLDYSSDGLARVILRKGLTATNEDSRKWCTRYLSVLASCEIPAFSDWGIQLMLRQLVDESAKVVRHSIRLLNRWLFEYPTRNIQKVEWSVFGEAGELLKAHYYGIEAECANDIEEVKEMVRYWMATFNQKYLDCIEEEINELVFSWKRSLSGEFSRTSSDKPDTCHELPAPLHLFGALASHATGRRILIDESVCETLLAKLADVENDEVKSSLLAIASIGSTDEGFGILPTESVPRVLKIAEEHDVLSIRGVAFWAATILSQSAEGAKQLAMFGWESNKHRWTTDFAKAQAAEARLPRDEDSLATSSLKGSGVTRKITHHQRPSIVEAIISKQGRAKSESGLICASKCRQRSSSDTGLQSSSSPIDFEAISAHRQWNSDLNIHTPSDASTPFQKPTWTLNDDIVIAPSSAIENMEDQPTSETPKIQASSFATLKLTCDRRRANTTTSLFEDDQSTKTRSSTVARCIRDGFQVPREQLENEGTIADTIMEAHYSCRRREKYHLAPFRVRASLQINRNVGEAVRYIFMTKDEERYFADYRRKVGGDSWLYFELKKEDNAIRKTINVVPLQTVALPAEIEIICGNIFPMRPKIDPIFGEDADEPFELGGEGRGTKSGHSRADMSIQPHSAYRCFHCSGKEEQNRTYPHPDAPLLRKEVLNQVDMLEIKEYPAKRLIGLQQNHEWLFKWPCLYADVLELLDEYRFKPHSRSFLQQIFYDALQL